MGPYQTPLENRHAPGPAGWGGGWLHPARPPGSCRESGYESSALHRKPITACLRGSAVGYFRRLGPIRRCSRRRGSPSRFQLACPARLILFRGAAKAGRQ